MTKQETKINQGKIPIPFHPVIETAQHAHPFEFKKNNECQGKISIRCQ